MTGADLDRLDAAIAAAPGPVIALPLAQLQLLTRTARQAVAAQTLIESQPRFDAAIAGIVGGHRMGIAPDPGC